MDITPQELLGLDPVAQVCYCGPHDKGKVASLSPEPLDAHHPGCLIWDWAMSLGKITPKQRGKLLDKWADGWRDSYGTPR